MAISNNFGIVSIWKKKNSITSKFVNTGSNNRNVIEGNAQHGMGRQRRMEKENEIKTLGTEISTNIENLYINKKYMMGRACSQNGGR